MEDPGELRTIQVGSRVEVTLSDSGRKTGEVVNNDFEEYSDDSARVELEIETGNQRVTVYAERDSTVSSWSGMTADLGSHEEVIDYIGVIEPSGNVENADGEGR